MKSTRIYLALTALVIASLACSLGSPAPTAEESEPEVVTIVVTATPEPTAEPTATAMATEVSGATATLNQDLNVRSGPGTAYSIQGALPGGTTVDIIGQNDAKSWWLISYDGSNTGWVSIPFTTYENADAVPVVAAPALADSSSSSGSSSGESSGSSSSGSDGGSSSGSDGGDSSGSTGGAPSDSDIITSVSVKNGNTSQSGEVSYPDGDTTDNVYVKPTGFDSVTTSGNLIFTLTCSGGTAKVKYTGGSIKTGSAGCNSTWTAFVTNVSADSRVQIYLDSNGYVNWTLVVAGSN